MNRAKVTLSLIFLAGLMTLPLTGCGRQQEGERCDLENADDDCDRNDDLVCTDAAKLRDDGGVDRCCPEDLSDANDSRCAAKQGGTGDGVGGAGGAGSGGSGSGGTGSGGDGSGGDNTTGANGVGEDCNFNSDCLENLVCGPAAKCQVECREDRDCYDGKKCDKQNFICK